MKGIIRTLVLTAVITVFLQPQAWACVGKTLQVGTVPGGESRLMTRMLSILVNERTGTSVKIKEYGSFAESFAALAECEVDLVIAFTGEGYIQITSREEAGSAREILDEVKEVFNREHNLVWLEPWGVDDGGRFIRDGSGDPVVTQAAPLVRKDALKKFPALARLVNKMSGRLDQEVIASLLREAETGDEDGVARDFLKAEKLI